MNDNTENLLLDRKTLKLAVSTIADVTQTKINLLTARVYRYIIIPTAEVDCIEFVTIELRDRDQQSKNITGVRRYDVSIRNYVSLGVHQWTAEEMRQQNQYDMVSR